MAALLLDRVLETTTTTGTGTVNLAGAQTGYNAFRDEADDGATVYYLIVNDPSSPTAWEYGLGTLTYGTPNTLSRDTVIASSNSGSKITIASGPAYTVLSPGGRDALQPGSAAKTSAYTLTMTDIGTFFSCDASSAGFTVTLPAAATATGRYWAIVANTGASNDVTIDADGSEVINGATTLVLRPGDVAYLRCDGSEWAAVTNAQQVVLLPEQASAPSTGANEIAIYGKEVNSTTEGFFRGESDGDEVQVTLGGVLAGEVLDSAYAEYATYSNTSAVLPSDDTIPQNTEGTELLSVAITPKSTSSKLYCVWEGMFGHGTSNQNIAVAMFRNGVANAIAATAETSTSGSPLQKLSDSVEISPSTTSEVTISVRYGTGGSGTVYVNGGSGSRTFGGVAKVTLKVFEIKG